MAQRPAHPASRPAGKQPRAGGKPANQSLTPCRKLAQGIFVRVAEGGAHASPLLDAAISRHDLSHEDAAWLTELVYGTLRHGAQLEGRLQRHLRAPFARLPPPVQCALRAAAYQILYMRVPPYTAVDATVEQLRRPFGKLAGVANAVLRRLAEEQGPGRPGEPPLLDSTTQAAQAPAKLAAEPQPGPELGAEQLASDYSHPAWLVHSWLGSLGYRETLALLAANNQRPPVSLRINPRRTTRAELLAKLQAAGIAAVASPILPEGILLRRAGEVRRLPGYVEGHFVVQDMAPALVSHLLEVPQGSTVIDLCAAPGGKSTHLAELLMGTGRVLAIDSHPGRLGLVVKNATRLGHGNLVPVLADACNPAALAEALGEAGVHGPVDYVLLDPPCSGTGTLRRHPELRRRSDAPLTTLIEQQRAMLQTAADLTAVGGRLVYAVCSVLPAEGQAQIERFLAANSAFSKLPLPALLQPFAHKQALCTWPHRHDLDGFFAVCLRRMR